MATQTETLFLTYWRDLNALLGAESETPATISEAVVGFETGLGLTIELDAAAIINSRITIGFARIQKAA